MPVVFARIFINQQIQQKHRHAKILIFTEFLSFSFPKRYICSIGDLSFFVFSRYYIALELDTVTFFLKARQISRRMGHSRKWRSNP